MMTDILCMVYIKYAKTLRKKLNKSSENEEKLDFYE